MKRTSGPANAVKSLPSSMDRPSRATGDSHHAINLLGRPRVRRRRPDASASTIKRLASNLPNTTGLLSSRTGRPGAGVVAEAGAVAGANVGPVEAAELEATRLSSSP